MSVDLTTLLTIVASVAGVIGTIVAIFAYHHQVANSRNHSGSPTPVQVILSRDEAQSTSAASVKDERENHPLLPAAVEAGFVVGASMVNIQTGDIPPDLGQAIQTRCLMAGLNEGHINELLQKRDNQGFIAAVKQAEQRIGSNASDVRVGKGFQAGCDLGFLYKTVKGAVEKQGRPADFKKAGTMVNDSLRQNATAAQVPELVIDRFAEIGKLVERMQWETALRLLDQTVNKLNYALIGMPF